jgi:hypothetical protein
LPSRRQRATVAALAAGDAMDGSDKALTLPRLAQMVHAKLVLGVLPGENPVKLWAGMGSGQPCTVCERPIMESEPEYEPQYDGARAAIRLHVECHRIWEVARAQRQSTQGSDPPAAAATAG